MIPLPRLGEKREIRRRGQYHETEEGAVRERSRKPIVPEFGQHCEDGPERHSPKTKTRVEAVNPSPSPRQDFFGEPCLFSRCKRSRSAHGAPAELPCNGRNDENPRGRSEEGGESAEKGDPFVGEQEGFSSKPIAGKTHEQAEGGTRQPAAAQHQADPESAPLQGVQVEGEIDHKRPLPYAPQGAGRQQTPGGGMKITERRSVHLGCSTSERINPGCAFRNDATARRTQPRLPWTPHEGAMNRKIRAAGVGPREPSRLCTLHRPLADITLEPIRRREPAMNPSPSTDPETGLTSDEVQQKLNQYGPNEITEKRPSRAFSFLKKFWGVTPWMLEVTIGLEWLLGKHFEAYVVAGLLVFNAILGFTQEERANAALELLKQKLKINARVRRNGSWTMVPAREIVPGDVVRVRAGDFIPADIKVAEGTASIDQSSLTGESQAVEKQKDEVLYSGSVVRKGEVTGIVVATGIKTYFGKTVELVQVAKPKLHMEEVTSGVVKWLVAIVGSFLFIALVFTVLRHMRLLEVLPLAVVLMVSAIPVALPTMFTISLALGSMELLKRGVLITRLSAIEDAATMTIVCADKTGTITTNKLSVAEVIPLGRFSEKDVILYGALASEAANQDAIDMAFIAAAEQKGISLQGYLQKSFVPFDASTRKTEATLEKEGRQFTALKGAVNTIVSLAINGTEALSGLADRMKDLSSKGYRALAVARRGISKDDRARGNRVSL